jgi:hypothetical protein
MFHHVKELQFNARVSKPDPKFARLLLEQCRRRQRRAEGRNAIFCAGVFRSPAVSEAV